MLSVRPESLTYCFARFLSHFKGRSTDTCSMLTTRWYVRLSGLTSADCQAGKPDVLFRQILVSFHGSLDRHMFYAHDQIVRQAFQPDEC